MESSTFRKWLVEQGCRIDHGEHQQRHAGQVMVTVHREGRKAEVPLGGSRQAIDPRSVRRACEELGLDPAQLPGRPAASNGRRCHDRPHDSGF
jgi:predicted PhzF superfamily epimerase YddE/YHI9